MTAWIVLLAVGVGTYALRAVPLLASATNPPSGRVEAALALVGPAAIAALLATMTLTPGGTVDALPAAELLAVAAGFFAVRRSGHVLHAFLVGFPLLWVATALGA